MSETTHTLYLLMDDKGACMPTLYPTRDAAQRAADTSANKWTPVPTEVPAAPLAAERGEVREAVVAVLAWTSSGAMSNLCATLGVDEDVTPVGAIADALLASRPQAGEVTIRSEEWTRMVALEANCKCTHPPAAPAGVTGLNRADVSEFLGNVVTQMRVIQRNNENGGRVAAQVRVLADEVQAWAAALTSEGA